MPAAIVIQCRLHKRVIDLYTDALSQIGLTLHRESTLTHGFVGHLQASGDIGVAVLAKLTAEATGEYKFDSSKTYVPVGRDLDDLRFFSDIINASGRRLVIEDFHYLAQSERKAFAHDLKALWDYKTFVLIIGIWAETNLLLYLNADLVGRIEEVSIYWSTSDLQKVITAGSSALNIEIGKLVSDRLIEDAYGTVGILQKLALDLLDAQGITKTLSARKQLDSPGVYESVAMAYADQLNSLYQTFANRVAGGIRKRQNSTGIYAHMLAVIMEADVEQLTEGISTDAIFQIANSREPRIQKGQFAIRSVKS